jgi:hypothetical protein
VVSRRRHPHGRRSAPDRDTAHDPAPDHVLVRAGDPDDDITRVNPDHDLV